MIAGKSTRAFTLIELMVAVGIATVISTAIFTLLRSGVWGSRRLTERASAEQDVRLALQTMSQEIEEGVRLFHPAPDRTGDGVGFVNARGEVVFYYLAKFGADGNEGRIAVRRACFGERVTNDLVTGNTLEFEARTLAVAGGRVPGTVRLRLRVGAPLAGEAAGKTGLDAEMATAVSLRALDRSSPDDPVAEPSPAPEAP